MAKKRTPEPTAQPRRELAAADGSPKRGRGAPKKPEGALFVHVGARVPKEALEEMETDGRAAGFVNARTQKVHLGKVLELWANERKAARERREKRFATKQG